MRGGEPMIRLLSPNLRSEELLFFWQQNAKVATEENKYIISTIYWVVCDVDELKHDKDLLAALDKTDLKSYSSVKELSEIFNRKLTCLRDEWTKGKVTPSFINRRANKDHLRHIIDYCYSRAVDEPDKLNQYVPFSAEVYGETSFELVDQIIEWVKFKPDDIFIDLGSGVGQVVLQVAATTDCRSCCGIEKADYPTKCALILEQEFRKLMLFFGKPFNQFSLIKGDFLGDEYQETISNATVIFANNFAFGPVVDHQLKNRFTSLKEGAKIISSKAFCPLKFRITDRNLDDIGSIMRVTSLRAMENAVSWTCTAFSYYLHQVDHSMLEDYFAKYKQNRVRVGCELVGGLICGQENDGGIVEHRNQKQLCKNEGSVIKLEVNEPSSNKVEMDEGSLTQSLDRSLHLHDHVQKSRSRMAKSMDNKNESPGRRASERLLRQSKKRPLFTGIDEYRDKESGGKKRLSLIIQERERGRLRKITPVTRSQSRSTSTGKRHNSKEENRLLTTDVVNKSNIDQLYKSTMETINDNEKCSINGGPEMTKFVANYVARKFVNPQEALKYASEDHDVDINIGQNNDVVPVAVHEYLELVKHRLMKHISVMQSPSYRKNILSEISNQLALRDQLNERVTELETQIPKLHREGVSLLTNHLHKLGIQADSPSSFFSEARKLIKDQARVESDNGRLKKEIGDLLIAQRELRDRVREQEAIREQHRHQQQQEALLVLRNSQMFEHIFQQQLYHQPQNLLTNGDDAHEYTSVYSPISKASSPDTTHNPSMSS